MANFNKGEENPSWDNMKTPKVLERMLNLYETSKWHDCVFKLRNSDETKEELVFAHNLVLASCSPVFEALCFGPLAQNNPIVVPDVDPLAFRMMLKFIYTDCIEFTSVEMACDVLYAAKKYLIYSLAGLSISYISSHINESNCLQLYIFTSFIQEDRLMKESWSYLCSHLDEASKYFSYESLTSDLIKNLVNEKALNGAEIILYKICFMWAENECIDKNLDKSNENLRKILIEADILNKIKWLTLTLEEFEEGPQKSGILTDDEIKFISKSIKRISHTCLDCENQNEKIDKCICKNDKLLLNSPLESGIDVLQNILLESRAFPLVFSNNLEARKKIELKKFYCHRFIQKEVRPTLGLQNTIKIRTYITSNKSVRLTAIFLNAKTLPVTHLSNAYAHTYTIDRDYNEKLFVSVFDRKNKILFSTSFYEKVSYGTTFKIALPNPVILESSNEYNILVDLLNSPEHYLFGVRNSKLKFPSGLCVTFREQASIGGNGHFIDAKYLSIISSLEVCL